jgi:hypothetical protein
MNLIHRWLCSSAHWKKVVETYILPWTLDGLNLGSDVLEVGPGPGVSTDLRRTRVAPLREPVADADALRLGALYAADAGRQLGGQQSVVGGLGGQLTNRRHSNNDGRRPEAALLQ